MRAISVMQPYASLIMAGIKLFETRSWSTDYRGRLGIHASKKISPEVLVLCNQEPLKTILQNMACQDPEELPKGALIGSVELLDVKPTNLMKPDPTQKQLGDWRPGRYAWELAGPKTLKEPIGMIGRLSVYELPEALARMMV